MTLESVLQARGEAYGQHGDFAAKSAFVQLVKDIVRETPGWHHCQPDQREALDMIVHKLSRILVGNPDNEDSWRDVAGYATLVADRLK